jgi:hypothetical protein
MTEQKLRNPSGSDGKGESFAERNHGATPKQWVPPLHQPAEGQNGKPQTPRADWQAVLSAHGRQGL